MKKYPMLDRFMSKEIMKDVQIDSIISNKPSETTDSIYYILKDTYNRIYSLSVSDHESNEHFLDLSHMFDHNDDQAPFDDEDYEDELNQELNPDGKERDIFIDCEYYSIHTADTYHIDPNKFIGQYSTERAFVSDTFKIRSASLLYGGQLLHVVFTNMDNDDEVSEDYINHPLKLGDIDDMASIQFLMDNYDVHDARKLFYQMASPVRLTTETEYRQFKYDDLMMMFDPDDEDDREEARTIKNDKIEDIIGDDEEIYTFAGKDYIISQNELEESESEAHIN